MMSHFASVTSLIGVAEELPELNGEPIEDDNGDS
jgi:hypothetical protein